MKDMKCPNSKLPTAAILLCVAVTALAVMSYWKTIRFEFTQNHQRQQWQQIGVDRGSFYVLSGGTTHDAVDAGAHATFYYDDVDHFACQRTSIRRMASHNWWLPGLEWVHWPANPNGASGFEYGNAWYVSIWLVLLVTAAVAVTVRSIHHQRLLAGLCASCGYDLRATPDCCPECGVVMTGQHRRN